MGWSGVEWSGVEWSGVDMIGEEWSGTVWGDSRGIEWARTLAGLQECRDHFVIG